MHRSSLLRALFLFLCGSSIGCAATGAAGPPEGELVLEPVPEAGPAVRAPRSRARCAPDDSLSPEELEALAVDVVGASATLADDQEQDFLDHLLFGPEREPIKGTALRKMPKMEEQEPWWRTEPDSSELAREQGIFRAASGWYVGPTLGFVQISSEDLDGASVLMGTDTIVLPESDPGAGGGVVLGYRFESMAFEFNYLRTEHDAEFMGTDFETTFQSFSLNLKDYFFLESRLQPFLDLGFASTKLVIQNGATMGAVTEDATLEGEFAINVGAGLSYYFSPHLSLNAHAEYRVFSDYDEADGVAGKGAVPEIDATGLTVVGSLTYTF